MLHLPARTSGYKVEERLHDIYDGRPVIAVEVFGPPEAMVWDQGEGSETGPWVLGDRDEVLEHVEETGFDYEIQYTIEHPED